MWSKGRTGWNNNSSVPLPPASGLPCPGAFIGFAAHFPTEKKVGPRWQWLCHAPLPRPQHAIERKGCYMVGTDVNTTLPTNQPVDVPIYVLIYNREYEVGNRLIQRKGDNNSKPLKIYIFVSAGATKHGVACVTRPSFCTFSKTYNTTRFCFKLMHTIFQASNWFSPWNVVGKRCWLKNTTTVNTPGARTLSHFFCMCWLFVFFRSQFVRTFWGPRAPRASFRQLIRISILILYEHYIIVDTVGIVVRGMRGYT